MKFVACADVHLDKKLFNIPDLFQDMFKYFEQAVNFAIEKKVDHFIMAGDVFDNNKPELETLERTRALINKLKNEKINVIGIVGDHDYNWLNPTYSWLKNVCAAEDSTSNNILTIDYQQRFRIHFHSPTSERTIPIL
jgi:DNA repair exonuclease SbcCD nuclease subunit